MNGNWMERRTMSNSNGGFSCTGTLHFQLETGTTQLSAKHLADFLVVLPGQIFSINFHQ